MKLSKLVGLAVLLLALAALVPALAGPPIDTIADDEAFPVEVTASIASYVLLWDIDADIQFGALDPTAEGWWVSKPIGIGDEQVAALDSMSATVMTNIPLRIDYNFGSDLSNSNDPSKTMALRFDGQNTGLWNYTAPTSKWLASSYLPTANNWSTLQGGAWVNSGATGSGWFAPGQTILSKLRARVFRSYLNDLAGTYSQTTKATMTVVWNN